MKIERCAECDEPTGRAGRSDDSIYLEGWDGVERGPLCETCRELLLGTKVCKSDD